MKHQFRLLNFKYLLNFPKIINSFLAGVFTLIFWTTAFAQASDGLYGIQGSHSERGTYHGEMLINGSHVERIIQYDHFQFKTKNIQEIWIGTFDSSTHSGDFRLRASDTLSSYENFSFPNETFLNPVDVKMSLSSQYEINSPALLGKYNEHTQLKSASLAPLWVSERKIQEITGESQPFIIQLARWFVIDKIIRQYRNLTETMPWHSRSEWLTQKQFQITDPTDFEFYQQNPNILRVVNKIISPLSMAEALQKRNAYALTLLQKAEYFDQEIPLLHLNSAGLLELAQVDPATNQKTGALPEHDSALWTSMYLLSQVLKFESTGSLVAYNNAKIALNGLLSLVDITNSDTEFARTLMRSPASEKWSAEWVQGEGQYAQLKYKKGGNNDMYKGVALSFLLAHRFLKSDETELQLKLKKLAPKLLTMNAVQKNSSNTALAFAAVAIWREDVSAIQKFTSLSLNLKESVASGLELNSGFYTGGISDWSGIHLISISNIDQIIAAQEIMKRYPQYDRMDLLQKSLESAQSTLHAVWKAVRKAKMGFITIFAYTFGNSKNFDTEFYKDLDESRWVLRQIPAPRKTGSASIHMMLQPDWSLSAWPFQPWKAVRKPLVFNERQQGAYNYPLFELESWGSQYLWKENPFSSDANSDAKIIAYSADYLLVYWMGRRSGWLTEKD